MPAVLGLQISFQFAGVKLDYFANTLRSFNRTVSVEEWFGLERAAKQFILHGIRSKPIMKYFFESKHGLNPIICDLNNPSVFLGEYRAQNDAISQRNSCIQEIHCIRKVWLLLRKTAPFSMTITLCLHTNKSIASTTNKRSNRSMTGVSFSWRDRHRTDNHSLTLVIKSDRWRHEYETPHA